MQLVLHKPSGQSKQVDNFTKGIMYSSNRLNQMFRLPSWHYICKYSIDSKWENSNFLHSANFNAKLCSIKTRAHFLLVSYRFPCPRPGLLTGSYLWRLRTDKTLYYGEYQWFVSANNATIEEFILWMFWWGSGHIVVNVLYTVHAVHIGANSTPKVCAVGVDR